MRQVLGVIVAAVCCLSACGDSNFGGSTALVQPDMPRVMGIKVTTYDDPYGEQGCVWGSPTFGADSECAPLVYPNPSFFNSGGDYEPELRRRLTLVLSLPEQVQTQVWIARILGPGEEGESFLNRSGAILVEAPPGPVKVVTLSLEDSVCSERCIAYTWWDFHDVSGRVVPPGFNRVYVGQGERLAWADLYFAGDLAEIALDSPEIELYRAIQGCV